MAIHLERSNLQVYGNLTYYWVGKINVVYFTATNSDWFCMEVS